MALLIVAGIVVLWVVGYAWWYSSLDPAKRAQVDRASEAARQRAAAKKAAAAKVGHIGSREAFSKVSTDGRCPNCGGAAFTAKRSVKGKAAAGVLAPKTQVKCVTCGSMFKRG